MLKFLKSICKRSGGASTTGTPDAGDTGEIIEYQGCRIQPTPRQAKNGWTTEAIITREVDGEVQTHHFIRADTSPNQEGAIVLSVSKSKTTIDQVGDRLFSGQSRGRGPDDSSAGADADSAG